MASQVVKEGFLCPICLNDFGDVIQLQVHFEGRHGKEDPAFVQNLKGFFAKTKEKIKKGLDDNQILFQGLSGSESGSDLSSLVNRLPEKPEELGFFHPVSGISLAYLEDCRDENRLAAVDHNDAFKSERARRADMLAMDTNKLIIRLEKLLTKLPHDPVKRRAYEQSIVPWIPEDVVKLCPNCAKSFNLTRRKHHCRLCGSVMCNDCSTSVEFSLAKRLVSRAGGGGGGGPDTAASSQNATKSSPIEDMVSNFVDMAGLSESQQQFRSCTFCRETLLKREARMEQSAIRPKIVLYYNKLRQLMKEGDAMSREYQETAERLNAGEAATKMKLEEAKMLRLKLLKMAETVDAVSKQIAIIEEDVPDASSRSSYETLRRRIRTASVNFVKETLVGLPSLPSEEELAKLQEDRTKEAAMRVEEEKRSAELARMKFDRERQAHVSSSNSSPSPKAAAVRLGSGFVSSRSGANYVSSEDPIVQQMANLREFIGQARSAGKYDDAKLLEENLKDLQEEYQRQKKQLEENYESYKHLFVKPKQDGLDNGEHKEDEEEVENVDGSEDSGDAINAKTSEEKRVADGGALDEYDLSGKNPFF